MPKQKQPSKVALSILEKVIDKRPENTKSVSFSQYSQYRECPKKWQLQYKECNYISKPTLNLSFGTAIHACIQEWLTILMTSTIKAADAYDFEANLEKHLLEAYQKDKEKNNNVNFSSPEEMEEFFEDGIKILKYLRKNRTKLVDIKYHELLANELQLNIPIFPDNPNILFNAFLDTVFIESKLGNSADDIKQTILIYDWKSSTKGWGTYDLKSDKKLDQLRLYKHFFSVQFNWPVEDIETEFKVLKRKVTTFTLDNGFDTETPRLQTVNPAQGKAKVKEAVQGLQNFVKECFNDDGTYRDVHHLPTPGNACRFCPFRDTEHCDDWV